MGALSKLVSKDELLNNLILPKRVLVKRQWNNSFIKKRPKN